MKNQTIRIKFDNTYATINQQGAGLMRLWQKIPGTQEEYLFGYSEKSEQAGCMGDVLFPWAGRVENSRYSFEEKNYELKTDLAPNGNALHGFAKDQIFEIQKQEENSVCLRFSFTKREFEKKGYPFSADLKIIYTLNRDGLTCRTEILNTGQGNLPFGLGFHPYLKLGNSTIDELVLKIPAKQLVEFDKTLKPTGKYFSIGETPFDFSKGKKIEKTEIDNCFFDLDFKDGIARTELMDNSGHNIIMWQDQNFPYLQIYSADTIGQENFRKGIALEPQTCCGYCFNMPEMGLQILRPGEKFEGDWGIKLN